jgi:hypothetical protein
MSCTPGRTGRAAGRRCWRGRGRGGPVGGGRGLGHLDALAEPALNRASRILRDACTAVAGLVADDAVLTAASLAAAADLYDLTDAGLAASFPDRRPAGPVPSPA